MEIAEMMVEMKEILNKFREWFRLTQSGAFAKLAVLNSGPRPQIFAPSLDSKILVVAPHPDDEVLGCGQILADFPTRSSVTCLTRGEMGGDEEVRNREFQEVMNFLGVVNYKMRNDGDLRLSFRGDLRDLSLDEYDYIFLPGPFENHPDHLAATKLVLQKIVDPNKSILFYEVWGCLPIISHYRIVTAKKTEAAKLYKSQMQSFPLLEMVSALNSYRGYGMKTGPIEGYWMISVGAYLNWLEQHA